MSTTNFPTSIDTTTNPLGTDSVATDDHAGIETLQNTAIIALENKVGVNGSAINTTLDYKLSGVTTGDKAVSKTGTEILTNKTLTSPTINSPTVSSPTVSNGSFSSPALTTPSLTLGSDATGDIYYRNSGGALTRLPIGSSNQLLEVAGGVPIWANAGSVTNASSTFTAGQAITAGDAVFIGSGTDSTLLVNQGIVSSSQNNASTAANWFAQSFTTAPGQTLLSSIAAYAYITSGGSYSVTTSIRSSLTGSDLISNTQNQADPQVYTTPCNLTVTPNTTYYIVMRAGAIPLSWSGSSSNVYAGGQGYLSTDSGGTWSSTATVLDFAFQINGNATIAGDIYRSSADTSLYDAQYANNFIGFAPNSISSSVSGQIITNGVVTGLSGLVTGTTYYISNTLGAISSSAGTQSKKVGIALSATTLLIKNENT
jgi:hypothetical protein